MLAQRAQEIAQFLLPKGKRAGNEWCVGNIDGEPGDSLRVHLSGEKSGVWSDFATGEAGDLINLWASNRKIEPKAALKEAQQYLGMGQPKFDGYKQKKFARPSATKVTPIISQSSVMNYLINERKLTVETINAFKIGEEGRKIIFPYWREGELIFVKYLGLDRPNGKKQTFVEPNAEPCLFGWDLIPPNARTLSICEGELDCMSLFQYGQPVLSVPFGGG